MILDLKDKDKITKYNDFIKSSPYGHFQQDMRWARLKKTWERVYFYIEEDSKIKAALSVIYIRDKKTGKNFFYGPRGPVCDPYDIGSIKSLIGEARDFARANDGFLLRLDPYYAYDEELIRLYEVNGLKVRFDKEKSSQPLLNMVLDIKGRNEDEIIASFSKNTRKHIRKSYRDGIETRVLGREEIEILYNQIVETAQRAGIGHRPLDYIKDLYDLYEDESRLSVCFYQGEPVCSSLLIKYGSWATSLYGGSSDKHKDMSQNYQINFEEIKYCIENGIKYYDMGGIFETDGTDGLYDFKKKFTEDNVRQTIGELDIVIDEAAYDLYMTDLNPHYQRKDDELNKDKKS